MAGSVNKVIIIGNLGRDPEVRSFQNGGRVVNLRLATTDTFKDREGNRQERTEWHTVAIFNEKVGEIAEKYLRKGSKVYLEGKLETRKWQDSAGQDRYSTEIVIRNFGGELTLLDGRGQSGGEDTGGEERRPASNSNYTPRSVTPGHYPEPQGASRGGKKPLPADLNDDIPF